MSPTRIQVFRRKLACPFHPHDECCASELSRACSRTTTDKDGSRRALRRVALGRQVLWALPPRSIREGGDGDTEKELEREACW